MQHAGRWSHALLGSAREDGVDLQDGARYLQDAGGYLQAVGRYLQAVAPYLQDAGGYLQHAGPSRRLAGVSLTQAQGVVQDGWALEYMDRPAGQAVTVAL
jgi:hypothetical protein